MAQRRCEGLVQTEVEKRDAKAVEYRNANLVFAKEATLHWKNNM